MTMQGIDAHRPLSSIARRAAALLVAGAVVAGCVTSGTSGTSPAAGSASPAASPAVVTPAGSSSAVGFYLRAWQSQALAPQYTFGGLPAATISGGKYIDGLVAIPMIYPGPIYIGLSEQPISAAGIDKIVAEARQDGLLGDKSDFIETPMPGSITAHIQLVVDGVTHELTGPMPSNAGETSVTPGSTAAFLSFWNRIGELGVWLGTDLGESTPYTPTSIAIMLTPPADASAGIAPTEKPWPLTTAFAAFGSPSGGAGYRCATVTGADLATLLPAVQAANALTVFVDSANAKMSAKVEVLVPGDAGPCAAQ
jgi:hypothetical protein